MQFKCDLQLNFRQRVGSSFSSSQFCEALLFVRVNCGSISLVRDLIGARLFSYKTHCKKEIYVSLYIIVFCFCQVFLHSYLSFISNKLQVLANTVGNLVVFVLGHFLVEFRHTKPRKAFLHSVTERFTNTICFIVQVVTHPSTNNTKYYLTSLSKIQLCSIELHYNVFWGVKLYIYIFHISIESKLLIL